MQWLVLEVVPAASRDHWELAEQLCCDCLQQGHSQSHTQEGGIPNSPKPNTGDPKATHSPPAVVLLLHQEGARSRAGHQASWKARVPWGQDEAVPTSLTPLGISTQSPLEFLIDPLTLQRYQGLGNVCKELFELDFRSCSATCSHCHAWREEKEQPPTRAGGVWAQESRAPAGQAATKHFQHLH